MTKQKVRLEFEGHIEVEIDVDAEDSEAWADALGTAWCSLPREAIGGAAELTGQEIVK